MEKRITKKKNERSFILLGFASITILFFLYSRIQDQLVTPEMIESLERLAAGFYLLLLISFGSIVYGIYRYHQRKAIEKPSGLLSVIARVTWNNKSRKIKSKIYYYTTTNPLLYAVKSRKIKSKIKSRINR